MSLPGASGKPVCFVVQGFGVKTDFTNGRKLDLDASYAVIEGAVIEAGLDCVRADKILHSGTIDVPMYRYLLEADLVIADLSTYNVNAAFELGVRYALRPHMTLVLAEEQFASPFDVNRVVIRKYKHLGDDVGAQEARRLHKDLVEAIKAILPQRKTDSPVYTYLVDLNPPRLPQKQQSAPPPPSMAEAEDITLASPAPAAAEPAEPARMSVHDLLTQSRQLMYPGPDAKADFATACVLLKRALELAPNEANVRQRLALATYKAALPDLRGSLLQARQVLQPLQPQTTHDPETLGVWGAIHKRLWDLDHARDALDESIAAYRRGFLLRRDYYNGINLAMLLDVRALDALAANRRDEAVADRVEARRVRGELIHVAEPLVRESDSDSHRRYWALATLWEAAVGLGNEAQASAWEAELRALPVTGWMQDSRIQQGERVRQMRQTLDAQGIAPTH